MSSPQPTSNSHKSAQYRLNVQPNYSAMARADNYVKDLTIDRDLERYRTVFSSKTNLYDPSRIVAPHNKFGIKFVRYVPEHVLYLPAGMDGVNNTRATGLSMTKPVPNFYNVI